MKLTLYTLASAAMASLASAAMCVPTSLVGGESIGADGETTFLLYARSAAGEQLPIAAPQLPLPGTFFYPLSLGKTKAAKSSLPYFQLQNGKVYAYGGQVFSTRKSPLLEPVPLFVSSDSSQVEESFYYVNATCDGKAEKLLRFANITPIPLGSASINGSFAKGTPLLSPVLDNLLTLPTAIDLVVTDYTAN